MNTTMKLNSRHIVAALILSCLLPTAHGDTLRLFTFEAAPYQVTEYVRPAGPVARGERVSTIFCAAARAGWRAEVRIVPQNRALHSLRSQVIDGYFAVDASESLDRVATRTHPIALEKWFFFSSGKAEANHSPRIGVIAGSNEARWLQDHDYPVRMEVTDLNQLLAVLARDRIDTGLADYRVLEDLLASTPSDSRPELQMTFLRYAPLYLYLSSSFTQAHPEFVQAFNQALPDCVKTDFDLSHAEQADLEALSRSLITELGRELDLASAIRKAPRPGSREEVMALDKAWQTLAPVMASEWAQRILDLPASVRLARWQTGHQKVVAEVMLITADGTLAGASQLTSDYWQGDEAKFSKAMKARGQTLYLSPLEYDASSSRFQVFASQPVRDPDTGKTIGVIALGLDIENALRRSSSP